MKMSLHPIDWCHVCGNRENALVDISYPDNAEHSDKDMEYIRICAACIEDARSIFTKEGIIAKRSLGNLGRESSPEKHGARFGRCYN